MKPFLLNNPKTVLFCLGCLSALAMAPVYVWPLMMAGYSGLLYLLTRTDKAWHCGVYSAVFFFGYFLTGLYWTSSSLFVDWDQWWWALPFSFAGLPFLLSLFPFVIFTLAGFIKHYRPAVFTIALILTDLARGHLFTGFPWNMPAHTWAHTDGFMSLLPIIGFYGLNTMTIILFVMPVFLKQKSKITLLAYMAAMTAATYIPAYSSYQKPLPENIIMVQTNVPQNEKWKAEYIHRNLDLYITMSLEGIKNDRPVFLIWPETAISQPMLSYPPLKRKFYDFIKKLPRGSILITGYLYQSDIGYMNGFAVLNDQGDIVALYNKHHLVPFGEYMPFGIDTLTGFTGLQSGDAPTPVKISDSLPEILPLICYEIIFPGYAGLANPDDIIVNLTNDSWFGQTAGPYQHFDQAVFRARENNVPVLRLSGNGISAIITNNGQVLDLSLLNHKSILVH